MRKRSKRGPGEEEEEGEDAVENIYLLLLSYCSQCSHMQGYEHVTNHEI